MKLRLFTAFVVSYTGCSCAYPRNPKVWKTVQAATLGVDMSLLATLYNLLRLQDRTDVSTWHSGDWFNMLFTAWVALIRVAYLVGVGGDENKAKKSS